MRQKRPAEPLRGRFLVSEFGTIDAMMGKILTFFRQARVRHMAQIIHFSPGKRVTEKNKTPVPVFDPSIDPAAAKRALRNATEAMLEPIDPSKPTIIDRLREENDMQPHVTRPPQII